MIVQPFSAKVCQAALPLSGRLNRSVTTQLKRVKTQHHDMLKHAAGHLFLSEFLNDTMMVCAGKSSKKAQRKFLDEHVSEAVFQLQEAGIIPIAPQWFSMAWFVFRWVILPFIKQLLYDYNEIEKE